MMDCYDNLSLALIKQFLPKERLEAYFQTLLDAVPWQGEVVTVFGRRHLVPRLTAWYGDAHCHYRYSGCQHQPLAWSPVLQRIRQRIADAGLGHYNCVLLNYYRNGQDSMGWHADDEPELGDSPQIASLSLGCCRQLYFRCKGESRTRFKVPLPSGSLLLMQGATQAHWQHALMKSKKIIEPRINLTFRTIPA